MAVLVASVERVHCFYRLEYRMKRNYSSLIQEGTCAQDLSGNYKHSI